MQCLWLEVLACLLQLAVAPALSSSRERETVETVVFGASRFVGSADTAANEHSSSMGPARVAGCAELNGGLLLLRWIVRQVSA